MTTPASLSTAYIGCFTTAPGHGIGIHRFGADGVEAPATPAPDPAFLVRHPNLPVLYALAEQSPTLVTAYAIAADGSLQSMGTVTTSGQGGCHLGYDPKRSVILLAHYGSGAVSVVAVNHDGSLGGVVAEHSFAGSGPDASRQEAPHAHQVVADGDAWLVADLGTDRIHRLTLADDGAITAITDVVVPSGTGPRHLVIDGDLLVLACELTGQLWLARRDGDSWTGLGLVASTTHADDGNPVYPSGIVRAGDDGDRIVVANRGPDTIATFALTRAATDADPVLTLVDEIATGGAWPRDLTWAGGRLWVANQNSDTVAVFAPDGDGWREVDRLDCPSPGCTVLLRS